MSGILDPGARVVWDERNNLYRGVLRRAGDLQPQWQAISDLSAIALDAERARPCRR